MLAIPITSTNMDIIVAVNDGVQPAFEMNESGGIIPTYLVMESGEVNRIINHNELMSLNETKTVRSTTRKFWLAS